MSDTPGAVDLDQGQPEAEKVLHEMDDIPSIHKDAEERKTTSRRKYQIVGPVEESEDDPIPKDQAHEADGPPTLYALSRSSTTRSSISTPSQPALDEGDHYEKEVREPELRRGRDYWAPRPPPVVPDDHPDNYIFMHHERNRTEIDGLDTAEECRGEDPAVLWTAKVFDSGEIPRKGSDLNPTVTYVDDRPLALANPSRVIEIPTKNVQEQAQPQRHPSWRGAVFKIEISVQTRSLKRYTRSFPKRYTRTRSGSRDRSTTRSESRDRYATRGYDEHFRSDIISKYKSQPPKEIHSLKIDQMSRPCLVVLSPFLYHSLVSFVGYYPSFYEKKRGPLADLEAEQASLTDSTFCIREPYAVLMHHFSQIEEFVNKDSGQSQASPVLPNEKEGRSYSKTTLQLQHQHTRYLYDFLKPLYEGCVIPCKRNLAEPVPRIAFDKLWYLFKPGTDVYIWSGGLLHVCVVADVKSNIDDDTYNENLGTAAELKYWILDLWYLDTNGYRIGRSQTSCRIRFYAGLCEVTKLDVCPVEIWDDSDMGERRQRILHRNQILLKSLKQGYLLARYNGPAGEGGRFYVGTVVIDHQRGLAHAREGDPLIGRYNDHCGQFKSYDKIFVNKYRTLNEAWLNQGEGGEREQLVPLARSPRVSPSWLETTRAAAGTNRPATTATPLYPRSANRSRSASLHSISTDEDAPEQEKRAVQTELSEHQLLLLYPLTRGFALKNKQWMVILADYVSEIRPSAESMHNLVIGDDELRTIRALSNRQNSRNETWAADFIEGKGSGQIILLHGPPGVGKTFSVEAIAEWLHRPLLALTVADIGTAETRIEGELVKWFSLAEAWNAVLLVDEADIFLERRQNRDLARNGLVSAFLRRMEYFKGLLFLTTNRVGQIDDAFISRVHVAIGYKSLSADDRKRIWNGFFRKLVKERAGKIQIAPDAKKWVLKMAETGQAQLNGRDIRNALQTAITLAESDCEEDPDFDFSTMTIIVTQSHFQRVLDISTKFHEYVASIRREDEKKRASGRGDRNDYEDVPLGNLQLR